MSDRSRKILRPAAAVGVLATMASVWWFALKPRRKVRLDQPDTKLAQPDTKVSRRARKRNKAE
jgi:hypothetical protein